MRIHCIVANVSADFATSIVALFVLMVALPTAACAASVTGGVNAADRIDSPYLILISIDGFRWDYPELYDTPALDRIAESGVRAEAMRPVYPTLTFPNHYSIATGLYPAEHGIVHNHFPNEARNAWYHLWDRTSVEDGRWYSGEPVWVAAEKSGLVTAAYYFVGTEAAVGGVSPSHWHSFDDSVPAGTRIDAVIGWLRLPEAQRPHVVTLYFEDVDDAGHDFGQGSAQLAAAVARIDNNIGRLLDAIDELGMRDDTYVLVVSDHGQSGYHGSDDIFILSDHIDLDNLEVVDGGSYASIYQEVPNREQAIRIRDAINAHWQHGRALLREDAPEHWRIDGNTRFPEIFVAADLHYGVLAHRDNLYKIKKGDHGWDPLYKDMHGIFLGVGPNIPRGVRIAEISAVDVYPLMLDILDIAMLRNTGTNRLRELLTDNE